MATKIDANEALGDTRKVSTVRVVVHTLGASGPKTSDNHWSIYLLLKDGGSVRINMAAEPGYIDGQLLWSKQQYLLTTSAVHHWDYPAQGDVKVSDIASRLYQYRRHNYDMSGGGSGCRYWVWTMITDWSQKGWIAAESANLLWPELCYKYHKTRERRPLHMVQGTFRY